MSAPPSDLQSPPPVPGILITKVSFSREIVWPRVVLFRDWAVSFVYLFLWARIISFEISGGKRGFDFGNICFSSLSRFVRWPLLDDRLIVCVFVFLCVFVCVCVLIDWLSNRKMITRAFQSFGRSTKRSLLCREFFFYWREEIFLLLLLLSMRLKWKRLIMWWTVYEPGSRARSGVVIRVFSARVLVNVHVLGVHDLER